MHDSTHIQMVAKDFSGSREREPSLSGTFIRLNVLDYKQTRVEQSDRLIQFLAYSCVGQTVIVIIIVASVKFEQWRISHKNNTKVLKHIIAFLYLVCN